MASLQKIKGDDINSSGTLLRLLSKPTLVVNNSLASKVPLRFLESTKQNKLPKRDYISLLDNYTFDNHLFLSHTDEELCDLAAMLSNQFSLYMNVKFDLNNPVPVRYKKRNPLTFKTINGIKNELAFQPVQDWEEKYNEFNARLVLKGLPPLPEPKKNQSYHSVCLRLASPKFWRKTLRSTQSRILEKEHVFLGHVGRKTKQLYVSNQAVSMYTAKRKRNTDLLESLEAINQEGYTATLNELSKVSTSNPELRRNELMARLRGLEEYADKSNLVGEFYTLTCPSEYHRYSSKKTSKGTTTFINSKFQNHTPRQAQAYLNKQWQKIRAELKRKDLPLLGMRVAEPHHDGCPHWHMLFFIQKEHRTQIRQVFRHYALEHNPDESGATKHRFTAIKIKKKSKNGKKQSAVGYIAKYISKNLSFSNNHGKKSPSRSIDTASFKNDGQEVQETVNRVQTWASVWGIRQFQQIGGERITIWRELRRIKKEEADQVPFDFESIHKAADTGNYLDFLVECLKRKKIEIIRRHTTLDTTIELIDEDGVATYHQDRDFVNIFEELRPASIVGLKSADTFIYTRQNEWQIKQRRVSDLGLVSLTVPSH